MSRRHAAEKREITPDAKFGDYVVAKFMNSLMIDGKKVDINTSDVSQESGSRGTRSTTPPSRSTRPSTRCRR